ncbi:hypothetical protein K7I13_01490 [Brucepastera parasyntrophica]|uniref:P83/100 family protein n=1 Tax=Brucepastera parasyntrophica TaxID=2880008 RepID=UPI00210D8BD2|nr:P83/100 family protein [Brucepastera parasyntrophica]ULQ60034.1 hypothetical protein K7I13_01490 [Brucepastera parasyntrophica]
MKKCTAVILSLFFICTISALEVDQQELQSAIKPIEFINYTGPQSVVNTAEEIRTIGTQLGASIAPGLSGNAPFSAGDQNRYSIIHAVDPSVTTGLDADILVLGNNIGVDHIDNLRRIISAYLSSAYGYSDRDASTLATFITIYNAVYRGDMTTLGKKYKPVVMNYLTADKAGLSVRYYDWPGKSQIIIPLSDPRLAGTISSIDTSHLTAPEVIERIKQDDPAATDTRKDMVDLKERESEEAQNRAQTAQTEAAQARTDAAEKQQQAAAAEQQAKQAEQAAQQAQQTAAENPDDKEAQAAAEDAQKTAEEKRTEADAAQQAQQEAEQKAEEKESLAQTEQTLADTKQSEAQSERRNIASDTQQDLAAQEAAKRAAEAAALSSASLSYGLRVTDDTEMLSELVLINLDSGAIVKRSPLNSIRNRTLIPVPAGYMAIAGKKSGNAAVRLVLIDKDTLEMTNQGTIAIAEKSILVQNNNDFYAVIEQDNGTFVLGRFDNTLAVKARSAIQVLPYTPVTITEKGVLVQNSDGAIRILRASDLSDQTKTGN